MSKNLKTVIAIPARGNSKSILDKNIKNIAGQPLISYTILDALRMDNIFGSYVSTDSIKIKKVAEKYGGDVPFLRPSKYAEDNSPDVQWVKHFLAWFRLIYETLPSYLISLRPTTPCRKVEILNEALITLKSNPEATSLRSVELFPETPYKWVKIDKEGYFQPLLDEDRDAHMKSKQDKPNVYRPNGYIDIYKTSTILKGSLCGNKILSFITPLSVEIDNQETFDLAEAVLLKERS